jgi:peptide/nickel transport system substrate-binding protein
MPDEARGTDRRSFLRYSGATAAGAVTALAGCFGDEDGDQSGGSVTITQGTFATTLDPNDHNDTPTNNTHDQAYESVLYRDTDGKVIANIATDWKRVDDTTVELEIRDDVTFHNGDDMTAEDVAFSINRTNDPEVSAQASVIGAIAEASAGDGSVTIDLEIIEPAIFRNLSAFGRVMQTDWVESRDAGEIAEDINGTGAYQLTEFEDDTRVVFERFDDYWGDEPDVSEITFDAVADEGTRVDRLIAEESDLVVNVNPRDIPDIRDEDGLTHDSVPSTRTIFLVMNDAHEPFDSVEFRQAMNYAVDVQSIIDSILNEFGEVTSQPTLPGHYGHNPDLEPYGHDPDEAERLVDESGHAGAEITIHSTTGRYLRDTDIAETAAGQIDELSNVSASAELRDTQTLFGETLDGDQETSPGIFLIGWGNPTFDANYTLAPWFTDTIFQHYNDDELVSLIEDANQVTDGQQRREVLQAANKRARDQAGWVFLHQQFSLYGFNDELNWEARQDEDINATDIGLE